MKRTLKLAALAVGAVALLTAGIRQISDFNLLGARSTANLPAGPDYTRALAYDTTTKTTTVYNGTAWRDGVSTTKGQGSSIESMRFISDGGTQPFGTAFAAVPLCFCSQGVNDGGVAAAVCTGSTTVLTYGGSPAADVVNALCVGSR